MPQSEDYCSPLMGCKGEKLGALAFSQILPPPCPRWESSIIGTEAKVKGCLLALHRSRLDQIARTPRTRFTLTPNQHIGIWKVGFKPQLFMREYLTRRGNAKLRSDQYQPAPPVVGAMILTEFFREQLKKYYKPELSEMGRNIIDVFLAGGSVVDYEAILPMDYQYAFNQTDTE
ncbi:MAG: DUF4914 family protein [Bacteroidales bacterium]|nr:DUF4914 family protein [Bacteroidales bacterium]